MSSNGTMPPDDDLPVARSMVPRIDDLGLPAKVEHTSTWLVHLVMTGGWICVLASAATTVYNEFFYYLPFGRLSAMASFASFWFGDTGFSAPSAMSAGAARCDGFA